MKHIKRFAAFAYFALCFTVFFALPVSAYLDPSTTTYLIQIVVGIFVVGGAAIGIFRHKIKRLFTKKDKSADITKNTESEKTDDMFD